MKINWRKLNRTLHREIGYFSVGLILIYAISGIALNHLQDWNPDLAIENQTGQLSEKYQIDSVNDKMVYEILGALDVTEPYKRYYYDRAGNLKIFLNLGSANSGKVIIDKNHKYEISILKQRKFFHSLNLLHRNNFKKIWTWVSDIFALGLVFLAISGLFILKGKYGLKQHGVWYLIAGIIIPILILLYYL